MTRIEKDRVKNRAAVDSRGEISYKCKDRRSTRLK